MFLKSVTLRGFKSFADKTQLDFEPGITVIVGPNGSGKSNVVDALAWVLGSHSPKSLRSSAMADVIFAGSGSRPALGRAAVEITIDNSDGALPIEFSEVTVSRAMFSSGDNDYAINGVPCRLLDVAELLSDTGLGRENHTIVGQGQLDAVLNARPEDRRAFIEEAAGILKYRRRRERAVRKLAAVEAHLERLTDLLSELRRSLRPLQRQAETAAKHAELAARLHHVRRVRGVRELDALTSRWDMSTRSAADDDAELAKAQAHLGVVRDAEAALLGTLEQLAPRANAAAQTHFTLANLAERFTGLAARIEERREGLQQAVEEPVTGRDPSHLRAEAADWRRICEGADRDVADTVVVQHRAEQARQQLEQARRAHDQAAAAEARRRAEARERLLRWEGEVAAVRGRIAQAASEQGRLASQIGGLRSREDELGRAQTDAGTRHADLDAAIPGCVERMATAEAMVTHFTAAASAASAHERQLERRAASLQARSETLRAAAAAGNDAGEALTAAARAGEVTGLLGPLAQHVRVDSGQERAVAAALGALGEALVTESAQDASASLAFVRDTGVGRVVLLPRSDRQPRSDDLPPVADAALRRQLFDSGARPVVSAVRAEAGLAAALAAALDGVYLATDLAQATDLAARFPQLTLVTPDGNVAGARGWIGGSQGPAGSLVARSAAEAAERELSDVGAELAAASGDAAEAGLRLDQARAELDAAAAALREARDGAAAARERVERLAGELANCQRELTVLTAQQAQLDAELAQQQTVLGRLEDRPRGSAEALDDGPDLAVERLDDELAAAREAEVQARLAAGAAQQQAAELRRRITALEAEADEVESQLAARERRRQRRRDAIARCGDLAVVAAAGLARAERSARAAVAERDAVDELRAQRQRDLGSVRVDVRDAEAQVDRLRGLRHERELARAELRHALTAARTRLSEELNVDPDVALAAARQPGDGSLDGGAERDESLTADEQRLARKLSLLGAVNPLALEEYRQLEQRYEFLTAQIDDLRASKADLAQVIEAVDERIRDVFAAAFADVAAQFERIFPRLFPGGRGRLLLNDPTDLLGTGVDVEARPPGKRVKQLSLLSGGERSLTALALLFAIFAARPSPFYVLDEVEAALDDVNLQRLLGLLCEFPSSSQLIVISHQKRTMEIADCLYGVTMAPGGVSKVVSQRLGDRVAALR